MRGTEDMAFSNGNLSYFGEPQTSGAGIGCRGEGRIPGQVEVIIWRHVLACEYAEVE